MKFFRIIVFYLSIFLIINIGHADTGFSALVIEPKSGRILYEYNANAQRYPASITKVMTLYIIFEDLARGKISIDRPIKFSQKAAAQEPSKLGAAAGSTITLDLAIRALIIKSANDVAVAVAENLAGNEAAFVERMNRTATRLGLNNTHFANPNGLFSPQQQSTAHDLAKLGIAIHNHFPQYYSLFSLNSYFYKGQKVTGHNRVNQAFPGADGIKTGYIRKSGFNLLTSAKQNDTRLFAVVLGGRTTKIRDDFMVSILNQSFALMKSGNKKGRISPTLTDDMIVGYVPKKGAAPKQITPAGKARQRTNVAAKPKPTPKNIQLPTINLTSRAQQTGAPQAANDSSKAAIQIGAFAKREAAQERARIVYRQLGQGKISIINSKNLYRARLTGFTKASATNACQKLRRSGSDCIVVNL